MSVALTHYNRQATFEDLALSIRTFGGPSATSVSTALDIFTQIEVLDVGHVVAAQ